jgi:hypothetical protein
MEACDVYSFRHLLQRAEGSFSSAGVALDHTGRINHGKDRRTGEKVPLWRAKLLFKFCRRQGLKRWNLLWLSLLATKNQFFNGESKILFTANP